MVAYRAYFFTPKSGYQLENVWISTMPAWGWDVLVLTPVRWVGPMGRGATTLTDGAGEVERFDARNEAMTGGGAGLADMVLSRARPGPGW
jgi:hypothetical protein